MNNSNKRTLNGGNKKPPSNKKVKTNELEESSQAVKELAANKDIIYHPYPVFKNYGYDFTENQIYNKRTKKSKSLNLKKEDLKNYIMNAECYKKIRLLGGKYLVEPIKFKWECFNNKIFPDNFIIEFLDFDKKNLNIDNLVVINMKTHYKNIENRIRIKSLNIHGKKYIFPDLNFEKYNKKINIQCLKCDNNFKQTINDHLSLKNGCGDCAKLTMGGFRHTKESAIAKANEKFGVGRFTYDKVPSENFTMKKKYKIRCVKHGIYFKQNFENHVTGRVGCDECNKKPNIPKTKKNDFIKLANKIHSEIREQPYKYEFLPEEFFRYEKIYVICTIHGKFPTTGYCILAGQGCPYCKNKTEGKLKIWLEFQYNNIYTVTGQFKVEWCKNPKTNKYLPFDFCIEELKLIISLDGRQHYEYNERFHKDMSLEGAIDRDIEKMSNAIGNEYSIIRIPQEYVWKDSYNWKELLKSNIKKYDKPSVIFLDFNNEYDKHRVKWK